jgi:hypothetical protein
MPEEPNEPLPARLLHIAAESVSSVKGSPQEVVVSVLESGVAGHSPFIHSHGQSTQFITHYGMYQLDPCFVHRSVKVDDLILPGLASDMPSPGRTIARAMP